MTHSCELLHIQKRFFFFGHPYLCYEISQTVKLSSTTASSRFRIKYSAEGTISVFFHLQLFLSFKFSVKNFPIFLSLLCLCVLFYFLSISFSKTVFMSFHAMFSVRRAFFKPHFSVIWILISIHRIKQISPKQLSIERRLKLYKQWITQYI